QLDAVLGQSISVVDYFEIRNIKDDWEKIKLNVFSLKPEDSFRQHSLVISVCLNTIEDSSELASLQSGNQDYELIIQAVIKEIPYLTETLGQSRGLGAGIATQAQCSVANRLKLGFLFEKGMNVLSQTVQPLLNSSESNLQSSKSLLQACYNNANGFLDSMDKNLISTQKITIPPQEFYLMATDAIDGSFNLLDALLDVLEIIVVKGHR
ncbi:MAG: hypothetical protein OEX07_09105, partial [Gammaproteobacteria bacterium]|nr:hypothetical protein [Gammaproteobacteria bacterium]